MSINVKQLLRAFILAGFAAFFIKLHYTGDIEKFINPKYVLTSIIAAGAFVCLFIVQLMRVWESRQKKHDSCSDCCEHDHHHDSGSFLKRFIGYAIITFPLITGFLLSPVTLDASIAAKKSAIMTRTDQAGSKDDASELTDIQHEAPEPNENYFSKDEFDQAMEDFKKLDVIQMDAKMYGAYYEAIDTDPEAFVGKKIKMNGFVYREEGLNSNQLVLARFYMIHCVADTSVVGFLSESEAFENIEEDTWLEIEGTLDMTSYDGYELPIIKAEDWTIIEEPDDPYIYPPLIQLVGG